MTHVFPDNLPFDGTFGYSVEQMLALRPPPEPPGFEAFWRDTYRQTLDVPLEFTRVEIEPRNHRFRAFEVHFNGFEHFRLGGWLIVPKDKPPNRFLVVGHGYYHKPFADCSYERDAAALFLCCRGMSLSARDDVPRETADHVVHGIEAKETYVHRGCIADTWSAASVLLWIYPDAAGRLEYRGNSFGGGIGAAALAWDERFVFGAMGVPSFGNYPLRVTLDSQGSGASVRRRWLADPSVLNVLAYFDAAVHAGRINAPLHVTAAAYDPAVPPPGQFTVYNAVRSPKHLFVLKAGHFDWPGGAADEAASWADREGFRRKVIDAQRGSESKRKAALP